MLIPSITLFLSSKLQELQPLKGVIHARAVARPDCLSKTMAWQRNYINKVSESAVVPKKGYVVVFLNEHFFSDYCF